MAAKLRVYELVPVLEKMVEESSKHKIACIECWEDNLYVGTQSGFVVHYLLEQGESPTGKLTCRTCKQSQICLQKDKPINKIMVVPSQKKLLVQFNSCVSVLHMETLQLVEDKHAVVKGILMFCRDEGVDISAQTFNITAAKKKGIYQYEFFRTLIAQKGSVSLEDAEYRDVAAMSRDGNTLCLAQRKMYNIVDLERGEVTPLFPYDQQTHPLIKFIGPNEFLVTMSHDAETLGMFVTGSGTTVRPPVQFSARPIEAACAYPYLLTLSSQSIAVHSLLDQRAKQDVPFPNGKILCATGGQIIVAGDNRISLLAPISFQQQIDELLLDFRVSEALTLAEVTFSSSNVDLDADEFERQREGMLALQRRAGLTYLKMNRFADGFDLLAASNTDPREMISLFPDLLPKASTYSSLVSTTGIHNIGQICKSPDELREAQKALATFLNVMRSDHVPREWASDIDTVLGVLYGTLYPDKLLAFVGKPHRIVVADIRAHLERLGQHHVLALLHAQSGNPRAALDGWKRLDAGEVHDALYPGARDVVAYLCTVEDVDLVFLHAEWLLRREPAHTVGAFTRRNTSGDPIFRADEVLEFLRPYGGVVMVPFLEFLVFDVRSKAERYHTRLVTLYLEDVEHKRKQHGASAGSAGDDVKEARFKLQELLKTSNAYHVEAVLERIKRTDLYTERATLHGKKGEHQLALDLLVNRLGDHAAAKQYCADIARHRDRGEGRRVFLELLRVYLSPTARAGSSTPQAIQLLNSHVADLDADAVLALVPLDWSIGVVDRFLRRSLRRSLHMQRSKRIEHGLARQENLQLRAELVHLTSTRAIVTDGTRCAGCGKFFGETDVVVLDTTGRPRIHNCKRCNSGGAAQADAPPPAGRGSRAGVRPGAGGGGAHARGVRVSNGREWEGRGIGGNTSQRFVDTGGRGRDDGDDHNRGYGNAPSEKWQR